MPGRWPATATVAATSTPAASIGQGDAAPVQPEPVRHRGEREDGQRGFRQIDAGFNLHGAP